MLPSPASEDELHDLLRLHLATLYQEGLGIRLLELFGVKGALRQPASRLRSVPGMTRGVLQKLGSTETYKAATLELKAAREEGASLLSWKGAGYPARLHELGGMPLLLYAQGREGLEHGLLGGGSTPLPPAVGVVGSRRPSLYGLRQARNFAGAFARRGMAVVSGLALGIDGEAHRAALDEGGETISVLGSGLRRIYPRENRDLARRIAAGGGALLSEFPMNAAPKSFHFPMRNRLLSGLSSAVLVVEAGKRSGSLITVNHALEQGKTIYVVPGRVDQPEAAGCLALLRDGATPAIEPADVLPEWTAFLPEGRRVKQEEGTGEPGVPLPGTLGARLERLFSEEDSWHPDRIAERLGLPAGEILSEIGRLELEGFLERLEGGEYARSYRKGKFPAGR
jgi:DNA processing protein